MALEHLSYRQFKNIFGDLGVTAWIKFNWLSNGLPDGEYNGITKRALTVNNSWSLGPNGNSVYISALIYPIPSDAINKKWTYGFSNYPIVSRNDIDTTPTISICVSNTGSIIFRNPNLHTKDEYIEYTKKHPIILYYYDNRVWGGLELKNFNLGYRRINESPHKVVYTMDISDRYPSPQPTEKQYQVIRDVHGNMPTKNITAWYEAPLYDVSAYMFTQTNRAIYIAFPYDLSESNIRTWLSHRVIVYLKNTQSPAQALSLAPQSLDEPTSEEIVKEEVETAKAIFSLDHI